MNVIDLLRTVDPGRGDVPIVELDDVLDSYIARPSHSSQRRGHILLASAVLVAAAAIGVTLVGAYRHRAAVPSTSAGPVVPTPQMLDGLVFTSTKVVSSRPDFMTADVAIQFINNIAYVRTSPGCQEMGETYSIVNGRLDGEGLGAVVDHAVRPGDVECSPDPYGRWITSVLNENPSISLDGSSLRLVTDSDDLLLVRADSQDSFVTIGSDLVIPETTLSPTTS